MQTGTDRQLNQALWCSKWGHQALLGSSIHRWSWGRNLLMELQSFLCGRSYNFYPADNCSQARISSSYLDWETRVNRFLPSGPKALAGWVLKPLYEIAAGFVVNGSSPHCRQTCCKHSDCPSQIDWTLCVRSMQMWKGEQMRLIRNAPIWRPPNSPVFQQPQGIKESTGYEGRMKGGE